jgi:hypothetical protein
MTSDPPEVTAFLAYRPTDEDRRLAALAEQRRRTQDANDYAKWGRTRADAEAERAADQAEQKRHGQ